MTYTKGYKCTSCIYYVCTIAPSVFKPKSMHVLKECDEYGTRGAGGRRGSGGASGRGGSGGASGSGGARGSGGLQCDPLGIGTSHTWHGSPDALCRTTPVTVQPLEDDESAVTCDAKLKLGE